MRVHVGTSGYNYPEWRGTFYPEAFPAGKMFAYYAERFRTVEINYTFYRMPTEKLTTGWREQAPPGFMYTLKAPRRITHEQRLLNSGDTLNFFCDAARVLGPHLATLLFQLPPTYKCSLPRLEAFLELLPADIRCAFEFRHDSWLTDEVFALLTAHQAALCIADFGDKAEIARQADEIARLKEAGVAPSEIAVRLGIGRASVYRVLGEQEKVTA